MIKTFVSFTFSSTQLFWPSRSRLSFTLDFGDSMQGLGWQTMVIGLSIIGINHEKARYSGSSLIYINQKEENRADQPKALPTISIFIGKSCHFHQFLSNDGYTGTKNLLNDAIQWLILAKLLQEGPLSIVALSIKSLA